MAAKQPVNILMVDDQFGKLLSYQAILKDLGENLLTATTGKEALDLLLENEIALILMDVSMPEMNGYDLAEMIHQHPRFQNIAIIFISAVYMTDLDRVQGYQHGAMDYISVPIVPELLRAKVNLFLDLYRKTRELELLNRELEQRVLARTEELQESAHKVQNLNGQLEQRLAELESIMKVLPVGVSIARDPDCHVVSGNAALSELLEVDLGDNISLRGDQNGRPDYIAYHHGKQLTPEELPLQRAVTTAKPIGGTELELHHKNGKIKHALVSANPLFDDSGHVRGAVGAFIDITRRKELERTLTVRAELLNLASEAIIVRELDGNILFWNAGAAATYGWTADESIGKDLHQMLHTTFPIPYEEIRSTLNKRKSWEGNLIQVTKDGRDIIVACRKILHHNSELGDIILEVNRDVSVQLRAEEALRKSEQLAAMGRMASIIAHEINNPLGAITNIFYLLREHPSLDAEARKYADMAEKELSRVTHITKQTLAFYRESAQVTPVSIPAILDEILDLHTGPLTRSKIELDRHYEGNGVVQGFSGELKQVFLNLILNGIEAMPNGGCLRLHVHQSWLRNGQSGVRVSILDTGTGVSPQAAKRLFEPFFSTKASKGTGLGLWISKGIIEKHEGTISFRSGHFYGKRLTCFSVHLPVSSALRNVAQTASTKTPKQAPTLNTVNF